MRVAAASPAIRSQKPRPDRTALSALCRPLGILHLEKEDGVHPDGASVPLEAILKHLHSTYSGRIAFEFMALPVRHDTPSSAMAARPHRSPLNTGPCPFRSPVAQDESERRWFARYIESEGRKPLSVEEKRHIFTMMTRSEVRGRAGRGAGAGQSGARGTGWAGRGRGRGTGWGTAR